MADDQQKSVQGANPEGEKESVPEHKLKDIFKEKPRPPKKMGHGLSDKRPHYKSFKSPGVK